MIAFAVVLATLGPLAYASPVSSGTNKSCVNLILPVPAMAQNAEYNLIQVNDSIDATAFVIDIDTWSSPTPKERLIRNVTVTGTYNISAQLCIPANSIRKRSLQIATHGLGANKGYWDVPINPSEYSYVKAAMDAGYSILTYDRLGAGCSDKLDAYTVVQAPLELEILRGITEMARNGKLLDHASSMQQQSNLSRSVGFTRFEKTVHVGHSFGSLLTSAFLTTYANLSDAALITGYFQNSKFAELKYNYFGLEDASRNNPQYSGNHGSGYLIPGTKKAIQTIFFFTRESRTTGVGGFEPDVLDYVYSNRQAIAASEIVSPSQLNLGVASDFAGPVQFVVAEYDFPVCQGDCKGLYNSSMTKKLYPKAKDVGFYFQEGTGHGLTLHKGANKGYKAMFDWLHKNGL